MPMTTFRCSLPAIAVATALTLFSIRAHAGIAPPLYHLTVLDAPGATAIQGIAINDAGQIVGTYIDADFNGRAVLWDAAGAHELGLPGEGDGTAYAINNHGQIVGAFNDYVNPQVGLLWDAATPSVSTTIGTDPSVFVSPSAINDDGVVVGGFGLPAASRAFVWTASIGLVDYGVEDETVEFQQARWSAINASGKMVGSWNVHSSSIHATVGQLGTAAVLPMSAMTDQFPSSAVGLNDEGLAVGVGLATSAPELVPVTFGADGSYTEIPGASLDQGSGCAAAINASGVIVGSAGIGSASGCAPGMKAWVYRDGTVYDLFDVVDDTAGFVNFQIGRSINASGVILGIGKLADNTTATFVLTPIPNDAIFADGFE